MFSQVDTGQSVFYVCSGSSVWLCIICVTALTLTVTFGFLTAKTPPSQSRCIWLVLFFQIFTLNFIFHIVTMHRQPYLAEHCWVHNETFQLPNCYCACYPLWPVWMFYRFNKKMSWKTNGVLFMLSVFSLIKQWNELYMCFYGCLLLIFVCFTLMDFLDSLTISWLKLVWFSL